MTLSTITTERLELRPATIPLLEADLRSAADLGRALGVSVAPDWPPEYYDDDARWYTIRGLQTDPAAAEWPMWYVVLRATAGRAAQLIGIVGYKGGPGPDGSVEVGYGVVAAHRRRGYATEAVAALIEQAFTDPRVDRVRAETYPDLVPSIGVMIKNGMLYVGVGSDEGVIRYEVTRAAWG